MTRRWIDDAMPRRDIERFPGPWRSDINGQPSMVWSNGYAIVFGELPDPFRSTWPKKRENVAAVAALCERDRFDWIAEMPREALMSALDAVDPTAAGCSWCKGTGRGECPRCDGKKILRGKCKCCDHRCSVPCPCGDGTAVCQSCRGSGSSSLSMDRTRSCFIGEHAFDVDLVQPIVANLDSETVRIGTNETMVALFGDRRGGVCQSLNPQQNWRGPVIVAAKSRGAA